MKQPKPLTAFLFTECTAHMACEQASAMAAMFRTIARLTDDKEIKALCAHGALQGDMAENDLDILADQANKGFPDNPVEA